MLIDVAKIPELRERRVDGARVRIGAATRSRDSSTIPRSSAALPAMPRCAVWFADDQIRKSATIGGNIVNASPAADGTPPLIAHQASVELACRRDGKIVRRTVPLGEFITGPGKTALQDGELLVAIECDALQAPQLREGRPSPLAGDLAGVPGDAGEARRRTSLRRRPPRHRRHRPGAAAARRCRGVPARRPCDGARLEQAADMPVALVASRTRQIRRDVVRGFVLRGLIEAVRGAGGHIGALAPELEAAYA